MRVDLEVITSKESPTKNKTPPISFQGINVTTWKDEEKFRAKYPQFFSEINEEDEVGPSDPDKIRDEF
ncbi:unnamed protein product [Cochlearia groenlandica]